MTDTVIQINPKKSSELEFDVVISGIDATNIPVVRFVVSADTCDYSFKCKKISGEKHKWLAAMPAFPQLTTETVPFRVEVIIDDYYFEPASGEIKLLIAPEVKFKGKDTPKPSVTTSFTVKQEEDEEPIEEQMDGGGGSEITGRYAPTNSLLKPEEDPTANGRRMRQDNAKEDEFTDKSRLYPDDPDSHPDDDELEKLHDISSGQQGLGQGKQYEQEDGKKGEDARTIADKIIRSSVGKVKVPQKKGTLFKRNASGKPIIAGLEDEETKKELATKAAKVKEILKSK